MTIYKLKNKQEYPIKGYDEQGNLIHYKNYVGLEDLECWFDDNENSCTEEEFNKIWEKVE